MGREIEVIIRVMESITKHLPQILMNVARYQLVIRAFGAEWTCSYQRGDERYENITAHGRTLEEAIDEMIFFFDNHDAFEPFRHKVQTVNTSAQNDCS